jgi:hypothetical protein
VQIPAAVVETEISVAFVTLKFTEFEHPTTVIREFATGTFPDRIWKVKVPVVVTALLLMTFPSVGPTCVLKLPYTYSGDPWINNVGTGRKGDLT